MTHPIWITLIVVWNCKPNTPLLRFFISHFLIWLGRNEIVKYVRHRSAGLLVNSKSLNPKVSYFCYLDYPTRHNWKVAVAKFMDPISAASKLEFHVRGAILQTRFFTIQSFNWKPRTPGIVKCNNPLKLIKFGLV